jgi:hypothetical protein
MNPGTADGLISRRVPAHITRKIPTMRSTFVIRVALSAAVAAALLAPAPAHAQFGKLLKKAKEKVAGEGDSTAAANGAGGALRAGAPKFDATVVELTPTVVDEMLRGMATEARVAQVSDARKAKLEAELDALEKESYQLRAQHPSSESDAWQQSNSRIEDCINDELSKREEANDASMQARVMGDPAVRQKMMELGQRASKETEAGDSVALRKTMADIQKLTHPSAGADSAAAFAKCGKLAPKPAWMAREDAIDEHRTKINDDMRASDQAARDSALVVVARGHGGGGAALTAPQYSMALERMIAWAAATGPKATPNSRLSFSAVELDALKARDADIRRVTADLRAHNVYR